MVSPEYEAVTTTLPAWVNAMLIVAEHDLVDGFGLHATVSVVVTESSV